MLCHEERPRAEQGSRPWGLWSGNHPDLIHNSIPTRVAPSFWTVSPSSDIVQSRRTPALQGRLLASRIIAFLFSSKIFYNKHLYSECRQSLRVRTTCRAARLNPNFGLSPSRNNIRDTFPPEPRRIQQQFHFMFHQFIVNNEHYNTAWYCRDRLSSCNIYAVQQGTQSVLMIEFIHHLC